MSEPRAMNSGYIEWAKLRASARYNLATSGVKNVTLAELGATLDDIEISGASAYGYAPLQEALARKCGVAPECVVAGTGTSGANHLAMAALIAPGNEVLIEHPAYDPVVGLASHLGARVKRFPRRAENGFSVDTDELARLVSRKTRLIVLTNLHNPSGALLEEASLRRIGEIARGVGARVLVDEVYLEMLAVQATPAPVRSSVLLGSEFVVTASLTKAYGLSGLRCGWILAEPEVAKRIWRLNDLFANIPAHPAERLSVLALAQLGKMAARSQALLKANCAMLDGFLDSHDDLPVVRPLCGTIVFPRLPFDSEPFCARLREKYETSVVPGKFFEMPEHIRIGIGGDPTEVAEGLRRLGACLDDCR